MSNRGQGEEEGTGGTERKKRTVCKGKGQDGQQAFIFPAQILSRISQKINTILVHGLNRNYTNRPENTAIWRELLLQH